MADEGLSWLDRLKRHYIGRVVIPYAVVIGFVMQLAARVFPYFGWSWAVPVLVIVLVASLPVVLVLTWLLARPRDASGSSAWQHQHRKLGTSISVVVVILAAVSGFFAFRFSVLHAQSGEPVATAQVASKSIAVLPFENLSADKNNEYFVAGMQDLILTKLADIEDLKVIARTSTAEYASHPENLTQIGQQLGVATILEGSVQKAGNQVLINVQLIDVKTDEHIWAQAYTRTLDNVFGVEGEVADKIATALNAKLSPAETATLATVPTKNREAYDLFLRAEYQANKANINYDTASMKAAIPLYRQTVEQDPSFALAWARLSVIESELAWFGGGGLDVKQLNRQARADAERALQLQSDLAAAQLALGYNEYWGRGDYDAALKYFAAALKLKPNDADALEAQGYVQRRQGRFDDAIASLQQALALDPRNSALTFDLGETYMMVNRYADAENALQHALALDPNNSNAETRYSNAILFSTGDIPDALAAAQGDDPALKRQRVTLLIYQRKYREALTLLDSIPDTPDNFRRGNGKTQQQADLYWLMGDMAHARPLYAQALPIARAQLAVQQGITLALVWNAIADDELGFGHSAEGLEALARSQAIINKSVDQSYRPVYTESNATLYAQAHRADLAVPLLAKALASPGIGDAYSPVMLWLDPAWDPIRHDPRFQALLQQYAKYKPAAIPVTVPVASTVGAAPGF